jgi:methionyl-tRNA formyltransferase
LRIVFCGTPQFAVPTLEALATAGHVIPLVLTQPDRPRGRGMELAEPAVKQSAAKLGLTVMQPEKIKNNAELRQLLEEIAPEAIVVVAYGRIIPQWMIDLPRHGNLNGHASLLPKYRGAAPIQWAVAMGETVTGVTTMRIDAGLDTGDMLLRREVPVGPEMTAAELYPVLAQVGAELMVETLAGLEAGTLEAVPQDHARATLAPILKREDGAIDFARPAEEI